MYVFLLLSVLSVIVMRVARVFVRCNVCIGNLVVYSSFKLFTGTDTEMLILYVSTRAQCDQPVIYTRCNVGAVSAMGYLYYRCGHCCRLGGNGRAQPRARERARQGAALAADRIEWHALPWLKPAEPRACNA